jgi:hypothetical protein
MVMFNFIPWREQQRVYQQKMTKRIVAISIVVSLLMMFLCHMILSAIVNQVNTRVASLTNQTNQFADEQRQLQEVMTSLSNKPVAKDVLPELFRELGGNPVRTVCFTNVSRKNNILYFAGNSQSAAEFTGYIKQWSAAHLFADIYIEQLAQQENQTLHFKFSTKIKN